MGVTTRIGNVGRNYDVLSSWSLNGEGASMPTVEVGASAWAIGRVSFTIGVAPFLEIGIENENKPNAKQILFEGRYLPDWPRRYLLDAHEVTFNANAGAAILDAPLKPVINVSGDFPEASKSFGSRILRFRAQGAPPASDGAHNYVAGDPTGFLGLGMSGLLGGNGKAVWVQAGTELKMVFLGSNFVQMCRDIKEGKIRSAASRSLSMLLARNHLQFHYSGLISTTAAKWNLGTAVLEVGSVGAGASAGFLFIPRLHLYIKHPNGTWFYVYSRSLRVDLSVSEPEKLKVAGSVWNQAWIK